jgi:conjugal transfer pilus assembly protein TrbC
MGKFMRCLMGGLLSVSLSVQASPETDFTQAVATMRHLFPNAGIPQTQATGTIHAAPQAVVFVSFSMPKLVFIQTLRQAKALGFPVVIRGLIHNDFKETATTLYRLVKTDHVNGVAIDPNWFAQYHIVQVPALVVHGKDPNQFDVVYGNIPVQQLLEKVAERGSQAAVAQRLLKQSRSRV